MFLKSHHALACAGAVPVVVGAVLLIRSTKKPKKGKTKIIFTDMHRKLEVDIEKIAARNWSVDSAGVPDEELSEKSWVSVRIEHISKISAEKINGLFEFFRATGTSSEILELCGIEETRAFRAAWIESLQTVRNLVLENCAISSALVAEIETVSNIGSLKICGEASALEPELGPVAFQAVSAISFENTPAGLSERFLTSFAPTRKTALYFNNSKIKDTAHLCRFSKWISRLQIKNERYIGFDVERLNFFENLECASFSNMLQPLDASRISAAIRLPFLWSLQLSFDMVSAVDWRATFSSNPSTRVEILYPVDNGKKQTSMQYSLSESKERLEIKIMSEDGTGEDAPLPVEVPRRTVAQMLETPNPVQACSAISKVSFILALKLTKESAVHMVAVLKHQIQALSLEYLCVYFSFPCAVEISLIETLLDRGTCPVLKKVLLINVLVLDEKRVGVAQKESTAGAERVLLYQGEIERVEFVHADKAGEEGVWEADERKGFTEYFSALEDFPKLS